MKHNSNIIHVQGCTWYLDLSLSCILIMPSTKTQQDELLVYGYIHKQSFDVHIPTDVIELCLSFFMQLYEILRFSEQYKSSDDTHLSDDRKCVKRLTTYGHRYILADVDVVTNGIHCWRVQVKFYSYI